MKGRRERRRWGKDDGIPFLNVEVIVSLFSIYSPLLDDDLLFLFLFIPFFFSLSISLTFFREEISIQNLIHTNWRRGKEETDSSSLDFVYHTKSPCDQMYHRTNLSLSLSLALAVTPVYSCPSSSHSLSSEEERIRRKWHSNHDVNVLDVNLFGHGSINLLLWSTDSICKEWEEREREEWREDKRKKKGWRKRREKKNADR